MSESDYYRVKQMMFDFMDKAGIARPLPVGTNRSNAKYYYRQALRYGDKAAAADHKKRFLQLGGNPDALPDQVKLAHPLSGLHKTLRFDFRQSLGPEESEALERAVEWYKNYVFTGSS